MRITRGSDFSLVSPTFVGSDSETGAATASTPTCTVTTEAGVALASPTVTASSPAGVYTAALTGAVHTAALDCLAVVWSGTVTGAGLQVYRSTVEVVDRHWVTMPEIRAYPDLDHNSKYPQALLAEIRDEYTDLIEHEMGVSLVKRYQRDQLFGNGLAKLPLTRLRPRSLVSVTIDGVSQTLSGFDITESGEIIRLNGKFQNSADGARNVVVVYEHGYLNPETPFKRALLKCIRSEAVSRKSNVPENALSQQFEGTVIRFSTPDRRNGRPTGILHLDPLLVNYSERIPGIG